MNPDQAHAEQGAVVPVNGWIVAAMILLVLLTWAVASWQKTRRRDEWARLARRDRLAAHRRGLP